MSKTAADIQADPPRWQQALARAVRDPAELLQLLQLDPALLPAARAAAKLFPLRVPRGYVARMRCGDPTDPLLAQVLPLAAECEDAPGFLDDPVGDLAAMTDNGVLHKYHGRVLLITTGACAINCRYCFRRHFPYPDASAGGQRWRSALDYLAAHPEVDEVILSGGDPLALSDRRLDDLVRRLEAIPHLKRLRVHSRLPIVLPERVDEAMLAWFTGSRLQPVMVVHANHPNELDDDTNAALRRLCTAGATVLNQTVLLRGVNDDTAVLARLSERLFAAGALPYYLHLLDRVRGAAHFEVQATQARQLAAELAARLPGYLVPKLVQELAGEPNKTLIAP